MKNSRQFQLLYLLIEHQELTAQWLSEKLEVSRRTIYRDLDALSAAGIPIYTEKGHGGGIRLMKQFQIDRSLLSGEEQEQILTALKGLEAVGAMDNEEVLTRLSGIFQKKAAGWLEVDFGSWGGRETEKQNFELCREAILTHRLLTLEYDNSEGEHSRRAVEPYTLKFKGGVWYLLAYCRVKQGFRLFRLNRMSELHMEKAGFASREIPEEETEKIGRCDESDRIALELLFTSRAAWQVKDFFRMEEIEPLSDGGYRVSTSFPRGRWVTGFLLSFGGEAEVLSPEWMRKELAEEAKKMLRFYE